MTGFTAHLQGPPCLLSLDSVTLLGILVQPLTENTASPLGVCHLLQVTDGAQKRAGLAQSRGTQGRTLSPLTDLSSQD